MKAWGDFLLEYSSERWMVDELLKVERGRGPQQGWICRQLHVLLYRHVYVELSAVRDVR